MLKTCNLFIFTSILGGLISTPLFAEESVERCMPDTTNYSAVGGRPFLQPLTVDCHLATVARGLGLSFSVSDTSDSNGLSGNRATPRPRKTNLSTETIKFGVTWGSEIKDHEIEFGIRATQYINMRKNIMSRAAGGVHKALGERISNSFNPKPDQELGAFVGNQRVDDDIQHSFTMHFKTEILEEDLSNGFLSRPNLAAMLTAEIPTSFENSIKKPAIGISLAAQKHIMEYLAVIGAASIACQLTNSTAAFESDDVRIRQCAQDYYLGFSVGGQTGFYGAAGLNIQENRIYYESDPLKTRFSPVATISIGYQNKAFDCSISFSEGLEKRPVSFKDDVSLTFSCKIFNVLEKFSAF